MHARRKTFSEKSGCASHDARPPDLSINKTFIISSAVQTKETVEIDGVTYPLFKLDTSSESHPFYTGAQTRIVEAGRVEKFRAKYAHVTKSAK